MNQVSPIHDWLSGTPAILFQRCGGCGAMWYLPRATCATCGKDQPITSEASGRGTIHACTLVHRAPTPEFKTITPYLLVFVDAVEGFRMMAHGEPGLAIGDAVKAHFVERAGRLIPEFRKS